MTSLRLAAVRQARRKRLSPVGFRFQFPFVADHIRNPRIVDRLRVDLLAAVAGHVFRHRSMGCRQTRSPDSPEGHLRLGGFRVLQDAENPVIAPGRNTGEEA